MTARTNAAMDTQIAALLADNTSADISEADVRSLLTDLIDTLYLPQEAIVMSAAFTCGALTSTGIDDNATSVAITIDSSENVGIGNASPGTIKDSGVTAMLQIGDGTGTNVMMSLKAGANSIGHYSAENDARSWRWGVNGDDTWQLWDDTGNTAGLAVDTSGNVSVPTGNLEMGTSGKGVAYTAAGGGINNYHDEGTYSGVIQTSTGSDYTMSSTVDTFSFVRNGNQTHVQGTVSVASAAGVSGNIRIPLPFVIKSVAEQADNGFINVTVEAHGGSFPTFFGAHIPGTSYVRLISMTDAGVETIITTGSFDTAFNVRISGSFIAADI